MKTKTLKKNKVNVVTLGCSKNIFDSEVLMGQLKANNFEVEHDSNSGESPIVVINKVDKPNCTPDLVHDKVFDLMFALDATEEQLNFASVYGSAKQGWMSYDWKDETDNIIPLLDSIIENIPASPYYEGTPQMQITSLDFLENLTFFSPRTS